MRKLFLKVYLPLAVCLFMTLVIAVIAIMRIIPAQINAHRTGVEMFRDRLVSSERISRDSVLALAESLDLDVMVHARTDFRPGMPPHEGYYSLPGLPREFPFSVEVSVGARGGPAGFLKQSFWLVLLLLLVSEGLVLFISLRPIRRRLARLQWAANELASGNLGIRLQTREKGDLIDDVGRTFNTMAGEIRSLVESHQELLGIVAHELRTPMARFRLALEILKEDSGNEHASKISGMEKDLESLDSLVTELLDYNKLRRAKEIRREEVDLLDLCGDLVRAESWSRDDIDIQLAGSGRCRGDSNLLSRAIGNLLRNAVKYAGSKVLVEVYRDPSSGMAGIRVSDDGPGYEPRIMDRLGEPFIKGPSSKGTGLGLAIAGRIAKLHGGKLSFGSSRSLGGAEAVIEISGSGVGQLLSQ
ncbi:MAG: HAMP domain-containing histidine kinase [Candidatus Fermentibacteraceae bacterium]|nr:HAMP domain-containing histidine kinase [Candidatus Fermentibacteraceae bacterium]